MSSLKDSRPGLRLLRHICVEDGLVLPDGLPFVLLMEGDSYHCKNSCALRKFTVSTLQGEL